MSNFLNNAGAPKREPVEFKPDPEDEVELVEGAEVEYPEDEVEQFEGSVPLANERYERMCILIVTRGRYRYEAYQDTSDGHCTKRTAQQQASRVLNRPEVAARLRWLQERETARLKAQAPADDGPPQLPEEIVTKDHLLRYLSGVVVAGGMDNTTLRAAEYLAKHLDNAADDAQEVRINPELIMRHMTQFAAWPGAKIVQEMGGLQFIIDQVCSICQVTRADIAEALSTAA